MNKFHTKLFHCGSLVFFVLGQLHLFICQRESITMSNPMDKTVKRFILIRLCLKMQIFQSFRPAAFWALDGGTISVFAVMSLSPFGCKLAVCHRSFRHSTYYGDSLTHSLFRFGPCQNSFIPHPVWFRCLLPFFSPAFFCSAHAT